MRYFFEISYNGARYNGWQTQPNGTGIQQIVEDSLSTILREQIEIVGSGRTDSGVHCEQQFFHTNVVSEIDLSRLQQRFNSILPPDIAIRSIQRVSPDAHARFDALLRTYRYRMVTEKNPFANGLAWHFFKPLNLPTMNHAAALLVGKHNFECFSKVNTDVKNFVCNITEARWEEGEGKLEFTVSANRFLRGMVRAIVGTLVDVGTGKTTLEEFESILKSRDRREAGQNVPPYGLYLVRVVYPEKIFLGSPSVDV